MRRYNAGRTLREITGEMGLAIGSKELWRAIHDRVETRRRGPRGRQDVDTDLILEMRDEDGETWPEIAEQVGMSISGVRCRYRLATTGERWR